MVITRSKKIALVAVGCVLLLPLVISQILAGSVDAESALEPLRQHVKELTGQPLITERLEVSVFPSPKIVIHGVAIRNLTEAQEPYLIYADELTISMSLSEVIFDDNPPVRGIHLSGLRLYLERDSQGHRNWSFVEQMQQQVSKVDWLDVSFDRASLAFVDRESGFASEIKNASGAINLAQASVAFNLAGEAMQRRVNISGQCLIARFNHFNSFDADCSGNMQGDGLDLDVKNRMVMHEGKMQTRGSLAVDTQDIRVWGDAFLSQQRQALQAYVGNALPVKMQVETHTNGDQLIANLSQFEMAQSKGRASLQRKQNEMEIQVNFERLDFDGIKGLIEGSVGSGNDLLAMQNGFDRNLNGSIAISADNVNYNNIDVNGFRMKGEFVSGEIVISEASGNLASSANFVSLGRVSSSAAGVQYQGVVETNGQNMADLMPMFDVQPTGSMRLAFPQYRARLNVVVSPAETILSEIRIVNSNRVRVAGGLAIKSGDSGKVTGSLNIENLNATQLSESWLEGFSLLDDPAKSLVRYNPFAFKWLKSFKREMELQINMQKFGFYDFVDSRASFMLRVAPNKFAVESLAAELGSVTLNGEASLEHLKGAERPFVDSKVHISDVYLGNSIRENLWAEADEDKLATDNSVWSKKAVNLNPLRYFDGSLQLSIDSLTHDAFSSRDVRLSADLNDEKLVVDTAKMSVWGGVMQFPFELDASSLPRLSAEFSLQNGNVNSLMGSWVDFRNLNGLLALNGNVRASGVNFSNWVDSMKGAVSFDARAVVVRYFNLAGIMRSVKSLRNVAGLSNAVRSGLKSGTTRFDRVNGVMTIENGGMYITNIDLASPAATGQLQGEFNLRQWLADLSLNLRLRGLGGANPPSLAMQFDGALESPTRQINLKSIEAYVAKKQ